MITSEHMEQNISNIHMEMKNAGVKINEKYLYTLFYPILQGEAAIDKFHCYKTDYLSGIDQISNGI